MTTTRKKKIKKRKFIKARFTTTLSITLVLFVIGLMAVGGLTAKSLTDVLREQFTITIEMSDSAKPGYGAKLATSLQKKNYVKAASYISSDSALVVLTEQLGENPESFLGYNPLHPTVELQLNSNYAVNDSIEPIIKQIKAQGGKNIERIDYNSSLVDIVNENLKKATIILAVVVVLLLLICFSLIGNAVRMSLYADRFLINTMQLVGATNWFIRKPLIWSNIVCGLIASAITLVVIGGMIWYGMTQGAFGAIAQMLITPTSLGILVVCVVVPGILIPAVSAWIAAGRYLRHSTDELFLM